MITETKTDQSASNLINFQKNELVSATRNGKPVITSLKIAKDFEKDHNHILRDIRNLKCSYEFSLSNFGESDYEKRGKKYPMCLITRDGFAILAMGFTGKKAMEWKEKYIAAFNAMEKNLSDMHVSILPMIFKKIDKLENKFDSLRINSSHYGPVWAFAHKYCHVGMNHVAAKDDLYSVYMQHCQTNSVHMECKSHFFMKLYHAVEAAYSSTMMMHGSKIRVVRGIGLKNYYKNLLQKNIREAK